MDFIQFALSYGLEIRSFHDDWRGPESLAFRKRRVLEAKLIGLRGTRGVSSRGYYD